MKKSMFAVFSICTMLVGFGLFLPAKSNAEVNVSITVPLPGLVISAPPAMVVIPGTYVYYPPDVTADVFFYQGYWYRPYRGRWYAARGYNGPWKFMAINRVPRPLLRVPPSYRRIPPGYERMPYERIQRNWRSWEAQRYWDRHERREAYREDHGRGEFREGHRDQGYGHGRGRGRGRHDEH